MTLEEEILYCEEVAEINQSIADNTDHNNWMDIAKCEKCADEHRQVAEWLRELKQYREQPEIVRCKDCKYWNNGSCECREHAVNSQDYYVGDMKTEAEHFCGYGERREVTK